MASIPLLRLSLPPRKTLPVNPASPLLSKPTSIPLSISLPRFHSRRRQQPTITAAYTPTPATDRLISAVSYFLPFFNGLQYGRFLFSQYPPLAIPFQPILPLLSLYRSLPYASFISFFALYLGVARNEALSRYPRFNALQAVLLDVLLVVPILLQRIFTTGSGSGGIGLKLTVWLYNGLFVYMVGCFFYSLACCILGKTPYLPLVSEAARQQL